MYGKEMKLHMFMWVLDYSVTDCRMARNKVPHAANIGQSNSVQKL